MADPLALALPPLPFGPALGIPSAMPFILTGEEYLRLEIVSANTSYPVGIHWRTLTARRGIQVFADSLVSDPVIERAARQKYLPLGEGLLLNIGVIGIGSAVQYGHLFARVTLHRGRDAAATMLGTLLSDYITARWGIGWPGSPIRLPSDTERTQIYYTNTAPPAGVEQAITVPSNANWELMSFSCTMVASAAAASRNPRLRFDDGSAANIIAQTQQAGSVTAGLTINFSWAQGLPLAALVGLAGNEARVAGLPMGLRLRGGHRVVTLTAGLQAGDQWGAARWFARETLEDF